MEKGWEGLDSIILDQGRD